MSTKTGTTQSTQKQELDPRMQELLYGQNGLFNRAQAVSNQPAINDRMRQGLDTQYAFLTSPGYTQDYQGMRSIGNSLMNRGVAGNPFNRGGNLGFGGGWGQRQGQAGQGAPSFLQALQKQQPQGQAPMVGGQPQAQQLTPEQIAGLNYLMAQDKQARTG